jgi:hypothetical protein
MAEVVIAGWRVCWMEAGKCHSSRVYHAHSAALELERLLRRSHTDVWIEPVNIVERLGRERKDPR